MYKSYDPIKIAFIIPTRNRSDLAIRTFHSIYDQASGENLSIFISDNSTDKQDAIRLAEYFQPDRFAGVELLRPVKPLGMTEHWEWAINQARQQDSATHFSIVTDRMLLRPAQLKLLVRLCRDYPDELISYTYDRINDLSVPIVFSPLPRSGNVYRIKSSDLLIRSSKMSFSSCLPRMLNSVSPRTHLDKLSNRFGSVFASIAPDFCFCYRSLAVTEGILYLDKSILLNYAQGRSNGGSVSRGEKSKDGQDFIKELGSTRLCHLTPIPEIVTIGNAVIHEYIYVQREMRAGFPDVSWEAYLNYLGSEVQLFADREVRALALNYLMGNGFKRRIIPSVAELSGKLTGLGLSFVQSKFDAQQSAIEFASEARPITWAWLGRMIHRYGKDIVAARL